jgi:hypothetical protein
VGGIKNVTDLIAGGRHLTDLSGIGQARRGWLEAKDVLNTRSWEELKKLLKKA